MAKAVDAHSKFKNLSQKRKGKTTMKTPKCLKCGNEIPNKNDRILVNHPTGDRYYCRHCVEILHERLESSRTYSEENGKFQSKPTAQGYTISKEFEIPRTVQYMFGRDKLDMILANMDAKGWIPTHDCTVWAECKSPIYHGLQSYNKDIKTIAKLLEVERWSHDDSYGTHTNIGHTDFNESRMETIRKWRETLITPLQNTIKNDRDGCIAIYGRYFTDYADTMGGSPAHDHCCFINLQHSRWVEFRLNKFTSVEQDNRATKMSIEIFDNLLNFSRRVDANRAYLNGSALADANRKEAEKTATKLVKVWEAYSAEARLANVTTA